MATSLIRYCAAAAAFALCVPAAQAQLWRDVVDPGSGRTTAELVALAVEGNGDLLAMRHRVEAARGGLDQARLRPNPIVEASGMKEPTGPMNSFMVGGSLPLELFHRRERRVEVAEGGVRLAEFERAEVERRLRAEVESRFGEALAAARNLRFLEELLALDREALDLIRVRAERGAAPQLDADMMRVEVSRIESMIAGDESKLGVALLELKSLAGMEPHEALRLNGTLDAPPTVSETVDLPKVIETRPDLLSLREAERVAEARIVQARTEARPDASITASYERADSGFGLRGITAAGDLRRIQGIFHLFTAGVSVSLPVRDKNQGAIAAAVAEREAARRRREYAELIARREVAAAELTRAKANESLGIYREGVREQAEKNLQVIRRTYELGRNPLLDVIAEQRRFIDVETGYTEALLRYYQATVRLRTAMGTNR